MPVKLIKKNAVKTKVKAPPTLPDRAPGDVDMDQVDSGSGLQALAGGVNAELLNSANADKQFLENAIENSHHMANSKTKFHKMDAIGVGNGGSGTPFDQKTFERFFRIPGNRGPDNGYECKINGLFLGLKHGATGIPLRASSINEMSKDTAYFPLGYKLKDTLHIVQPLIPLQNRVAALPPRIKAGRRVKRAVADHTAGVLRLCDLQHVLQQRAVAPSRGWRQACDLDLVDRVRKVLHLVVLRLKVREVRAAVGKERVRCL